MTENHPITPTPELMNEWRQQCSHFAAEFLKEDHIATQAARWGADQQLEQDAKWLDTNALFTRNLTISPSGDALRQEMRPRSSSWIKEEALDALDELYCSFELPPGCYSSILKALEQLDD